MLPVNACSLSKIEQRVHDLIFDERSAIDQINPHSTTIQYDNPVGSHGLQKKTS
jgi:hypothetical protein